MKKFLFCCTALSALAMGTGGSNAADVGTQVLSNDWSGFYIGADVGYGEGYFDSLNE